MMSWRTSSTGKAIGSTPVKYTTSQNKRFLITNAHIDGIKKIVCAYDFWRMPKKLWSMPCTLLKTTKLTDLIHIIHEHFYFNSITPIADPASTIYQDNQDELKKAIKK